VIFTGKMAASGRRLGNVVINKTVFFLCDMQEKFRPAIKYFEEITEVARRLVCTDVIIYLMFAYKFHLWEISGLYQQVQYNQYTYLI